MVKIGSVYEEKATGFTVKVLDKCVNPDDSSSNILYRSVDLTKSRTKYIKEESKFNKEFKLV